jgi:Histidyl-tRNA synthetase
MVNHFCRACHDHFKVTLEYLDELKLGYVLDHYLVRGLDYYTNTVFEIVPASGGASLGGGGRYDYLIEDLGGEKRPRRSVGRRELSALWNI